MGSMVALVGALATGLAAIFADGNIGLDVALICLILSLSFNVLLLRKFFKFFDVVPNISKALDALNQRIGHD